MKSIIRISGIGKLFFIMLLPILLSMVACGGGGGGGGESSSSGITYTGITTQATIDSTNADTLSNSALEGGYIASQFSTGAVQRENLARPYYIDLYVTMEEAIQQMDLKPSQNAVLAGAISRETGTLNGKFGNAQYDIQLDTVTGVFSGTFVFNGYSADGILSITGPASFSGTYNSISGQFPQLSFTFDSLVVTDGITSKTLKMTISYDNRTNPATVKMDGLLYSAQTGETTAAYYALTVSKSATYVDFSFSGKIYLHDYGYVNISTTNAFRINSGQKKPFQGVLIVDGKSGTKARLTALSSTQYKVEADTNGDGTYEWDSGSVQWQ